MYFSAISSLNLDILSTHSRAKLSAIFLLSVIFLAGCASISNTTLPVIESEKIYTPAQVRADLNFIDQSLKQIHPELFARLDPDVYQAHYEQLYLDLSWSQRRHDFYRLVAPLVTLFSDSHTRILYPQREYQQFLEQHGQFPLAVLYSSDGLIVVADQQQPSSIPVGAKLLAINSIDINTILDKFNHYIPSETESGHRRMIQMEFSRLLWSVYAFETDYQIDYLWQGKAFRKTVNGVKQKPIVDAQSIISHYGAIDVNQQTTLIWLNDFNEQYDKFEQFLDQEFAQIRSLNKTSLILDLRYNQGGITDNLALFLSYLTADPVHWASRAMLKLSKPFRKQHSLLLDNAKQQKYGNYFDWLPVEYMNLWQWEIFFSSDGELLESDIKPVISDRDNYFTGDIYVLSNGYCFSACASLVATLQQNNLATVVGELPGSLTHVQYGYPIAVELPNTGLKLIVPAVKFMLDHNQQPADVKISQEHLIERRGHDVLSGQDPVLELAIKLSKSR